MSNNKQSYYHGCGRLKYEFRQRYSSLPTFMDDGCLYASSKYSTAYEYATSYVFSLDEIVINLESRLKLSEIADIGPLELEIQLLSIIEGIMKRRGTNIGNIISSLAGYFPISRKEFRKVFLDVQNNVSHKQVNYIFGFLLENEKIIPNTFPCETTDYGVAIPLVGDEKSQNAVNVPITFFVKHGHKTYEKIARNIPALKLESQIIEVQQYKYNLWR